MAGYGDDAAFSAWLADNGYTLPAGGPAQAVLRQRGSTYLDGLYEARLAGVRSGGFAQERAQPRKGGTFNGEDIPADVIPASWVQASYFAAYQEALRPGSLAVVVTAAETVKREKIGALEVEYFEASGDLARDTTPILSAVEGLVAPFFAKPTPSICVV